MNKPTISSGRRHFTIGPSASLVDLGYRPGPRSDMPGGYPHRISIVHSGPQEAVALDGCHKGT
jgi:hypothetical protein